MASIKVLTVNPGSTSTKIAVFVDEQNVFQKNIKHSAEELAPFEKISDQFGFRRDMILNVLKDEAKMDITEFDYIVGRGGLIKPVESGIYEVNEALKQDLIAGVSGQHASNLGGLIAADLAKMTNGKAKAYIADPVVVDELDELARLSGHPAFPKISIFHALNQKAIARTYAKEHGKKYEDLNLIVVHLGGGISVGAHSKGRVIDVENCLDGNGPFSPERTGSLPVRALVDACFSGKYTQAQLHKMICGQGGFVAYLGTNDAYEVEQRVKAGDKKAALVEQAMIYQIAKEVGGEATVLKGQVDAILVTGGIARGKDFVEDLKKRIAFIAPVFVYPGEDEMKALAMNACMLHRGEIEVKKYM
ncbi:MAG: butyrate kinase [Bacteroidales bacterium]|nr:butyrate kinase [Bacteroidales bacterium]